MMIKMVGAVLIIVGSTLGGFVKAHQLAVRPKQIRALIHSLQRLMTEITYGLTPLPDAIRKIAVQTKQPLRFIFATAAEHMTFPNQHTAQESIQAAVHQGWTKTEMKLPEKAVMLELSYSLGMSDRQEQVKHLLLAIQQLVHEEQQAQIDQQKYEKMSRSLGALVGALIVILIF